MQTRYAIVGARFRPPAQDVLNLLPAGTELLLQRQPDNPYDTRAVAVLLEWQGKFDDLVIQCCEAASAVISDAEPLHLGYIPAKENADLAALMDAEGPKRGILTFALHGGPMVELA